MSYIDALAAEILSHVPPELIPERDTEALFRSYAVLVRAKGIDVSPSDVHDAWAAWMSAENPRHAALRPYDELTPEVRAGDEPYVEAIRAVARQLNNDSS